MASHSLVQSLMEKWWKRVGIMQKVALKGQFLMNMALTCVPLHLWLRLLTHISWFLPSDVTRWEGFKGYPPANHQRQTWTQTSFLQVHDQLT